MLIQPIILIAGCLFVGICLGAYYMHRKYNMDITLLETDLEIAHERLKELLGQYNVVRSKKDAVPPTKLDDTFKAQLQMKDDTIERLNGLRENDQTLREGLEKNLQSAASQIIVLEGRLSKNKKVAIEREKELTKALKEIDNKLDTIDELKASNRSEEIQIKSSNDEISDLNKLLKSRDNTIERQSKRIIELEGEIEELKPSENETGFYKRMKRFE